MLSQQMFWPCPGAWETVERAGGREPEAEGGKNRRNLKCEATFRTCAGWAQPSQKTMFEPCRVLKKNPLLTRLRTTPGCWKVFGSGALYHSFTKWRRMLDACQRVLHASGPDPPEPQKAHSRKRDVRGPQDLSCEPSCGGAHITFLVNVSRKNTMTNWSPPDRTTRSCGAILVGGRKGPGVSKAQALLVASLQDTMPKGCGTSSHCSARRLKSCKTRRSQVSAQGWRRA